ncbi:hypothetical protein ABVT39_023466 [Epinephelus coioides]
MVDHNENHAAKREQATTAEGLPRHDVVYQKQSKQWVAKPIYKKTTQSFRHDLMERVVQRHLSTTVKYRDSSLRITVPPLAANIGLVPKPSKEEAITAHTSRFN